MQAYSRCARSAQGTMKEDSRRTEHQQGRTVPFSGTLAPETSARAARCRPSSRCWACCTTAGLKAGGLGAPALLNRAVKRSAHGGQHAHILQAVAALVCPVVIKADERGEIHGWY